jgi:hypothetical protein
MRPVWLAGSAALLATAAVTLVTGSARAGDEPGSGLGLFSLAATAPAMQVEESDPSLCFSSTAGANGCEGVVPEAVATLRSGPIGHGLATVAWPGGIAAGGGSLLLTVGGSQVPSQATLLNDPVRADAYTNVGSPTSSYDVPGTTMTASALPARVAADAAVSSTTTMTVGTAGSTSSHADVQLTGSATATAHAHSEVKDLTVAGVVRIASVVSDATAETNGVTSSAKGATTATGITVAGVPVTVDDRGVTAAGTTAAPDAEQAAVNSALSGAGVSMALGAPQGKPDGPKVGFHAQSLVVVFTNPTGFTTTVVLGGADVAVTAAPGFSLPSQGGVVPPVATATLPAHDGAVPPPSSAGVVPGSPRMQPTALAPSAAPAFAAEVAALPDPGPIRTRVVVLVLGSALLLVGGLRRLPDEVLRHTPVECRSEGNP